MVRLKQWVWLRRLVVFRAIVEGRLRCRGFAVSVVGRNE